MACPTSKEGSLDCEHAPSRKIPRNGMIGARVFIVATPSSPRGRSIFDVSSTAATMPVKIPQELWHLASDRPAVLRVNPARWFYKPSRPQLELDCHVARKRYNAFLLRYKVTIDYRGGVL